MKHDGARVAACRIRSTIWAGIGLSLKALSAKPVTPGKAKQEEEAILDELEKQASHIKKPTGPLKGGKESGTGGEQFGLNW